MGRAARAARAQCIGCWAGAGWLGRGLPLWSWPRCSADGGSSVCLSSAGDGTACPQQLPALLSEADESNLQVWGSGFRQHCLDAHRHTHTLCSSASYGQTQ
eukprot:3311433-Rhodomonas_salina.1